MKRLLSLAGAFLVAMLLSGGALAVDVVAVRIADDADGDAFQLELEGYVRETLPGANMSAAYLSLRNNGETDLQLQSVEVPDLEKAIADLHTTINENGVSRMRPLAQLAIPAGEVVTMTPGGLHLMLRGVQLRVGEALPLRLRFASGITLEVEVPVRGLKAAEAHHHHG
ncbi:copper chaperone PCu(A)C [Microbulbifer taiwanensis]|uniref:Copper chaperone PCu(A)C n=1 Tax=Microbulbifer taiwanensis TaxID=986746 RepID=A0ABW1YQT5_9GAMM|nr:copper chaperone PCu(A)C [Microbulbifer taiwanensis]